MVVLAQAKGVKTVRDRICGSWMTFGSALWRGMEMLVVMMFLVRDLSRTRPRILVQPQNEIDSKDFFNGFFCIT